ncbi:MAG: hypothetical protein AAGC63_14925 [Propionicimonas sp.]|nr:hypothetical protein [Propionicimonas sp.]
MPAATTPASTSTVASAGCPPPPSLSWSDDPFPDGTQFGSVRHFDGRSIYLDPAERFSNEDANQAAREDGRIGPTEELPNPVYIRNPDPGVVRVDVWNGFTLTTIDAANYPAQRTLSRADLASLYCPGTDTTWMYSPADHLPVDVIVSGGRAHSATEYYLP